MENKNVFIAIALSMSVLLFWSAFVDPPQPIDAQNQKVSCNQPENKVTDNGIVPSIDGTIVKENISRADSLKKTNRIFLENNKIKGSISLEGATIDDLSFKNYTVDKEDFISGIQKGIKLMKMGETIIFVIPSYNAFGVSGDGNKIGLNKTIKSKVTLLNIKH